MSAKDTFDSSVGEVLGRAVADSECQKWTLNKLETINGKNTSAFDNVG